MAVAFLVTIIIFPACFLMRESELYQDARLKVSTDSMSDFINHDYCVYTDNIIN